jgi:hypothetical protein
MLMIARCDNGHGQGLGWSWSRNYLPPWVRSTDLEPSPFDHKLVVTSVHRDVRYQVLQNLSSILGHVIWDLHERASRRGKARG